MLKQIITFFTSDKSSPSYPRLPIVNSNQESNISGLYLVGDVAGSPLVKVGLNAGYKLANSLAVKLEGHKAKEGEYDVVIVGGGVSGIATALRLKEKGYKAIVIESGKIYQTLRNFTKGKILYSEPPSIHVMGSLPFEEDTTEKIIKRFEEVINNNEIIYNENEKVIDIKKEKESFTTVTVKELYKSKYVVLAIGKTGNPRKAGVKGETEFPEKIKHILKDPNNFKNKNILIYGGGDVALEATIALSGINENVTLAYRGNSFTRPKKRNIDTLRNKEKDGKVKIYFNTTINEITKNKVTIENTQSKGNIIIDNDYVFEMLGTLEPIAFFKKVGIKIEFAWDLKRFSTLIFSFILVYLLYAWKKGYMPFHMSGAGINSLSGIFKNTSFWYSGLYSMIMIIFGSMAMKRWSKKGKDKYQIYRFISLIIFQALSFIVIECIFALFLPSNTWWRAYAINNPFPLLFDSFYNMFGVSTQDLRWIFVGLGFLMTFLVLPICIRWHGKRFCTWICGCGGLAETLGDTWRHHCPKGEKSQKLEVMGTFVMFWAFITAIVILFIYKGDTNASGKWHSTYALLVDFWMVAVIPVTLYPIWGGKIWCRYWCPLAKYMQFLSKSYSRLEITSNEHCIQCTKCSRYCQVGVDVMSFAKNQEPFSNKNSSCIHCGICITVCPMNVLKFELKKKK